MYIFIHLPMEYLTMEYLKPMEDYIFLDIVYFQVRCFARVPNWAKPKNICQVEPV